MARTDAMVTIHFSQIDRALLKRIADALDPPDAAENRRVRAEQEAEVRNRFRFDFVPGQGGGWEWVTLEPTDGLLGPH